MNRIVNQFFGVGDILFLVPLIRKWQSQGDKVIWPIIPEYLDIQRNFPDINFVDKTKFHVNYDSRVRYKHDEYWVEPLRWADLHKPPPANCMRAKYDLYDEDYRMWRELCWLRNPEREQRLFNFVAPKGAYNLISETIGSVAEGQFKIPIEVNNGLPNVYIQSIPGYTLLDWMCVIENAEYIHVRGSSISYILDVVDLKAKEVHVYKRNVVNGVKNPSGNGKHVPRENHFDYYRYLMTKKYVWHE